MKEWTKIQSAGPVARTKHFEYLWGPWFSDLLHAAVCISPCSAVMLCNAIDGEAFAGAVGTSYDAAVPPIRIYFG